MLLKTQWNQPHLWKKERKSSKWMREKVSKRTNDSVIVYDWKCVKNGECFFFNWPNSLVELSTIHDTDIYSTQRDQREFWLTPSFSECKQLTKWAKGKSTMQTQMHNIFLSPKTQGNISINDIMSSRIDKSLDRLRFCGAP